MDQDHERPGHGLVVLARGAEARRVATEAGAEARDRGEELVLAQHQPRDADVLAVLETLRRQGAGLERLEVGVDIR